MKQNIWSRIYWILMVVSIAIMTAHQIWIMQQPSDEEVQRRIEEGLRSQQLMEEERKFEIEDDRIFGTHNETNR